MRDGFMITRRGCRWAAWMVRRPDCCWPVATAKRLEETHHMRLGQVARRLRMVKSSP